LRRSTKQQQRVAEQRAEIDHGANGDEDQQRENLGLDPGLKKTVRAPSGPMADESGMFTRRVPKPMGSSSVGSYFLAMARYINREPIPSITTCFQVIKAKLPNSDCKRS